MYLDYRKWMATGSWASVNSKAVKGIRYDRKSRRLFVESSKGVVMSYEGVHPLTAKACFDSKLVPKFIAKRLLRKYACMRHNLMKSVKAIDNSIQGFSFSVFNGPNPKQWLNSHGYSEALRWRSGTQNSRTFYTRATGQPGLRVEQVEDGVEVIKLG